MGIHLLKTAAIYLLVLQAIYAQKPISGVLRYKTLFTESPGHTAKTDNLLLFVGDKSMAKQAKETPIESQSIVYHKNLATKVLISRDYADEELIIVDDVLKPIGWKILTNRKIIGGFSCQKARGRIRGRNYTAWFAPAVAVKDGPWKLYGLPGLILEAEDDTHEVQFEFESLTISAPGTVVVAPPVAAKGQKRMNRAQQLQYIAQKYDAIRKKLEAKPGLTNTRVEIKPSKAIELIE